MSKHRLEVTLEIDEAALEEHNREAQKTGMGIPLDVDPSEWDSRDLLLAAGQELLISFEVTDYWSVE